MNILNSYTRQFGKNKSVSLESQLNPGLPKVSFAGLQESLARENLVRVRSAVQSQGFEWSLDRHLVFSFKGEVGKQAEPLLDLSLALSFLMATEQLKIQTDRRLVLLGNLNLKGELEPLDLSKEGFVPKEGEVWVGNFKTEAANTLSIKKLSDFNSLKINNEIVHKEERGCSSFSKAVENISPVWAELFEIVVHGEHSLLFLSPEDPELAEFFKLIRVNLQNLPVDKSHEVRLDAKGKRPFVSVNLSASRAQILGQGEQQKGLYYFANGGLAYIDHFFNLSKPVRDSVKSLFIGGDLMGGKRLDAVLGARSPLCPCGKAKVGKPRKCSFSLYKCRAMIEKLSIDELSLFQMIVAPEASWFELYPHPDLDLEVMNQRRRLAFEMQKQRRQVEPNSKLSLLELREMMSEGCKTLAYLPSIEGLDRTRSILSVARTLADLEGAFEIEAEHIERAKVYVFKVAKEVLQTF